MKIKILLLSLLTSLSVHAIEEPIYKSVSLTPQRYMNVFGFYYMQSLKKEIASQHLAYFKYLNANSTNMTKQQMLVESAKLERMALDEACLNIYFDEIAISTMGSKSTERLIGSYEVNKKKIQSANYNCEENLERILNDNVLSRMQ
ncbi:hypothetical protein Q5X54_17565 [Acinetobacter baumannii]|nr:hypothetical protein [Acinetobacter baumannii]MDV7490055.1 hypothetical protein [Acinetobacter baumannii]